MDVIGLASLLAASLLFDFLAYRAVRARPRWVKLAGSIPAGLFALLCGAGLVLALVGYSRLNAVRPNPVPQLRAALSSQLVANGERFARSCAGCHSADGQLPLTGHDFFGAGGPPIGTLWAPNLTPAHLTAWSDGEIVRAIREGVGRGGSKLTRTTFIQRLNTSGGVAPSTGCSEQSDIGKKALVPYITDYFFYKAAGDA